MFISRIAIIHLTELIDFVNVQVVIKSIFFILKALNIKKLFNLKYRNNLMLHILFWYKNKETIVRVIYLYKIQFLCPT